MGSLKEIKSRIASVRNTLKITSAMKMVASAKLHKAQVAIGGKLPYEQQLHRILAGLLQDNEIQDLLREKMGLGTSEFPVTLQDIHVDEYPSKDHVARVALVVFSSNSSLCGSFNVNIIKRVLHTLDELAKRGYAPEDIDIYAVGRKVAEAVRKAGYALKDDRSKIADKPSYDDAADLATDLVDSFAAGAVSQVMLLYNHFASPGSQPSVRENYLPLSLHDLDRGDKYDQPIDYILEPDPLSLVKHLLPQVLLLKIYTVLLDANAAEHAARTLAMQIASDNAQDLIAELTLAYNKGRQQEITAEILDLVGGTMA